MSIAQKIFSEGQTVIKGDERLNAQDHQNH